ncbi:type II toxin-antitoxin system YoeB family toxin [Sulfurivirga caldicuralii]
MDHEHRLVYKVTDSDLIILIILQCRYHN